MNSHDQAQFNLLYQSYLNELTLQGKSDNTIDAYSRCIRQLAAYFDTCPDQLTVEQLKAYFLHLVNRRSWSLVKISRNAIQFLYRHLLHRPWQWVDIVKPPKPQALQDVLTIEEVQAIINATRQLRYQTFVLTTYSLGLRLSEALHLTVADIDRQWMRVHIRASHAKGAKARRVPLPQKTLWALRRYWCTHRHSSLLFPSGHASLLATAQPSVMDRGGVQKAIKRIARQCHISKNVHIHTLRHSIATHMLASGLSLRAIQAFLGHASPKTTAIYTRMTDEVVQNSAAMLNALIDSLTITWQGAAHD